MESQQDAKTQAPPTKPAAEDDESISSEAETALRIEARMLRKKKAKNFARSPILETPASRQFIVDLSVMGSSSNFRVTSSRWEAPGQFNSESSGFNTNLHAKYGLTKNFYLGADFGFTSSKDRTNSSITGSSPTESRTQGIREPSVMAGAQTLLGPVRLISELTFQIPLGPSKREMEGAVNVYDGLDGGSELTPKLAAVVELGMIRLIGSADYAIRQDRKKEYNDFGLVRTETLTGGNTLSLVAGLEFPRALNLGLAGVYGRNEATTTRSSKGTSSSGSNSSTAGAMTYAEIKLADTVRIRPIFLYATQLGTESPDITIDKADVFSFGVNTAVVF